MTNRVLLFPRDSAAFLVDVETYGSNNTQIEKLKTIRAKKIRSQLVSLEFFIDIILPIALWPWGRLSL